MNAPETATHVRNATATADDRVPWPEAFADRYRREGYWREQTLYEAFAAQAATRPTQLAIVDGERRLTYAELDHRARALATGLHRIGIGRGERVVVQLPNRAELLIAYLALFRLGAAPVCALPVHRRSEISSFCEIAGACAYITCERELRFEHRRLAAGLAATMPLLRHLVIVGEPLPDTDQLRFEDLLDDPIDLPSPDPGDLALLQLSGGTTAIPKLIPRTHNEYLCAARACLHHAVFDAGDVYLAALPAPHNFTLVSPGCIGALVAGGTVAMAPAPSPDVCLPLIESERVTHTSLVPPVLLLWLEAAVRDRHDRSSLRVLQVGGAKCSAAVAARVKPVLGTTLQQMFGMAEGLINCTRLDDPDEVIVNTQGRPVTAGDELLVLDPDGNPVAPGRSGQLLTRGPYTVRGYYRAPEHNATAFTADGYYRTGDVVRIRPDGNIVVEGRVKDQINRGGEKVAAEEIENHLLSHPDVHDAAVVAMPDRLLGERTCAFVIARDGLDERPSPALLRRFLAERELAAYKLPDRIELIDAFPVSGIGKISKPQLRAAITARLAADQQEHR